MSQPRESTKPEETPQPLNLTPQVHPGNFDARRDLLTKVLITTAQDPHASPSDRVRATQYLEEAGVQVKKDIPL